jgi:hypothetical protein
VSPTTARQMVLVSLLVTGGVVIFDVLRKGPGVEAGSEFRVVWSVAVLFLLLAMLADVVPGIAGPLALLILLAVTIGRGAAVQQITRNIPGGKAATTGG